MIDQSFADFVQTIRDSHVTSADLATVASDQTAFIQDVDTAPGDTTTIQQVFTSEGGGYGRYSYEVSTPLAAGFIGPALSNFGVLTDYIPAGLQSIEEGLSLTTDENTLDVEFATLAEKSGLTVADLNRLGSDDVGITQLQWNDVGVNWNAAQTAIGQLVIAAAAGTSTSQAQTDFRDSFSANAPAALLTQTINDVIQAVQDSHVTRRIYPPWLATRRRSTPTWAERSRRDAAAATRCSDISCGSGSTRVVLSCASGSTRVVLACGGLTRGAYLIQAFGAASVVRRRCRPGHYHHA